MSCVKFTVLVTGAKQHPPWCWRQLIVSCSRKQQEINCAHRSSDNVENVVRVRLGTKSKELHNKEGWRGNSASAIESIINTIWRQYRYWYQFRLFIRTRCVALQSEIKPHDQIVESTIVEGGKGGCHSPAFYNVDTQSSMQARTQTCTHARAHFFLNTSCLCSGWGRNSCQGWFFIKLQFKKKLEFYVSSIDLLTAVPLEYIRDNGTQISRGQEQS